MFLTSCVTCCAEDGNEGFHVKDHHLKPVYHVCLHVFQPECQSLEFYYTNNTQLLH